MDGNQLEQSINEQMAYDGKSKEVFITFWLGGNKFVYPIREVTTCNGMLFIHAETNTEWHFLTVE